MVVIVLHIILITNTMTRETYLKTTEPFGLPVFYSLIHLLVEQDIQMMIDYLSGYLAVNTHTSHGPNVPAIGWELLVICNIADSPRVKRRH